MQMWKTYRTHMVFLGRSSIIGQMVDFPHIRKKTGYCKRQYHYITIYYYSWYIMNYLKLPGEACHSAIGLKLLPSIVEAAEAPHPSRNQSATEVCICGWSRLFSSHSIFYCQWQGWSAGSTKVSHRCCDESNQSFPSVAWKEMENLLIDMSSSKQSIQQQHISMDWLYGVQKLSGKNTGKLRAIWIVQSVENAQGIRRARIVSDQCLTKYLTCWKDMKGQYGMERIQ